jgi:hypothetical protein
MTGWEMFIFVSLVVGTVLVIVGVAWFIQWKWHPEQFKAGWRRTPPPGSPMHWRNHR